MHLRLLTRTVLPALLLAGPVSAQQVCDHINVETIQYAPFGGGLDVLIHNGNDQFLSHPRLMLVNTSGDTVGYSTSTFFGIAEHSPQWHQVETAGLTLPSPLSGALHFTYISMDGPGSCIIPFKGAALCPEEDCTPLVISAYHFSNAPAGEISWSMTNSSGTEVAQGSFAIDPANQGASTDELCLPPGEHTLHLQQTSGEPWEFVVSIAAGSPGGGGVVKGNLLAGEALEIPFSLYGPCAAIAQSVHALAPVAPRLWTIGQQLHIATDGSAIGPVQVLDAMGRTVQQGRSSSDRAVIDLHKLHRGTYLLRSIDPANPWRAQRFVLQ